MAHRWFACGSKSYWVGHSSRPGPGMTTDTHGIGVGEDYLGPFRSVKMAKKIADALSNAYAAGLEDGKTGKSETR